MLNPFQPTAIDYNGSDSWSWRSIRNRFAHVRLARWSGILAATAWISFGLMIVCAGVVDSLGSWSGAILSPLLLLAATLIASSFAGLLCSIIAIAKRQFIAIWSFFACGVWCAFFTMMLISPPNLNFCC